MEGQEGPRGVEPAPTTAAPPAADADVPGHTRPIDASQKRRLWKFFDGNYVHRPTASIVGNLFERARMDIRSMSGAHPLQ